MRNGRSAPGCGSVTPRATTVGQHTPHLPNKGTHVAGVQLHRGARGNFGDRGILRCDHRSSALHGLQHGQAKTFVQGRVDECQRSAI